MKFFFAFLFLILFFIIAQKFAGLLIRGKLFDGEAIRASFRESGRTLWQGARLFVVLWLLYLLLNWWVRHQR